MANTTAIANQFKLDAMAAILSRRNRYAQGCAVLRFCDDQRSTTAYTATGEATGAGYTAGGVAVTAANAPILSGNTACWTPTASITSPRQPSPRSTRS